VARKGNTLQRDREERCRCQGRTSAWALCRSAPGQGLLSACREAGYSVFRADAGPPVRSNRDSAYARRNSAHQCAFAATEGARLSANPTRLWASSHPTAAIEPAIQGPQVTSGIKHRFDFGCRLSGNSADAGFFVGYQLQLGGRVATVYPNATAPSCPPAALELAQVDARDRKPGTASVRSETADEPGWVQPSNEAVLHASRALIGLVTERLPQRFYREHRWRMVGAAMIVRMADIVDSLMVLMAGGCGVDSSILLRALYEHVVTYCWISIDRDDNYERWRSGSLYYQRALHNDAKPYGIQVLAPDELEATAGAEKSAAVPEMAKAVDEHWGSRLIGFRPPQKKPGDILTFSGLYVALYRIGSRAAHAQMQSLDVYGDFRHYPREVHRPTTEVSIWWPIAVPLYAQALLVCYEQLRWPDPDKVRAINNAMYEI
jgi:hypothetical protein